MGAAATLNLSGLNFTDWDSAANDRVFVTGDRSSETITGSSQADDIRSGGGSDVLNGGLGNDTIIAGMDRTADRDRGADTLTGGKGNDLFDFNRLADSGTGPRRD